MIQFQLKFEFAKELERAFRDYPRLAQPILEQALTASQFVLAKNTLKDDPVPFKTGNLLQSFRFQKGKNEAKWGPRANYALAVHEGTKPHIIRPRNKRALYWAGGQHPVKQVNHPGTKSNRYMPVIAEKARPEVEQLFTKATEAILRDIKSRAR